MRTNVTVSIVCNYDENGLPGRTTATLDVNSGGYTTPMPILSAPKPWHIFEKVGEFFSSLTEEEFMSFTKNRKQN